MVIGLSALALQGCIVYEDDDCDGWCGWEDGWEDGWCDPDAEADDDCDDDTGTTGDPDEPDEPEFTMSFAPGQAEQGETFLGHLTVQGEFDLDRVTELEFTGGANILWSEIRMDQILLLVDVPADARLGEADLIVSRSELPAVLFESALFIGAPGSGNSSDDCE
jgi:hypothetical protein